MSCYRRGVVPAQTNIETGQSGGSLEGLQPPACNDAKVGPSPSEGPEEIRVLCLGGFDELAVGEDNRGTDDGVQCQAVCVGAEAKAAMEEVPGYADSGPRVSQINRNKARRARKQRATDPGQVP